MNIKELKKYVNIKRKKYDEEVVKAVNRNDKNEKVHYLRVRCNSYQDVFDRIVGKDEESKKFNVKGEKTEQLLFDIVKLSFL